MTDTRRAHPARHQGGEAFSRGDFFKIPPANATQCPMDGNHVPALSDAVQRPCAPKSLHVSNVIGRASAPAQSTTTCKRHDGHPRNAGPPSDGPRGPPGTSMPADRSPLREPCRRLHARTGATRHTMVGGDRRHPASSDDPSHAAEVVACLRNQTAKRPGQARVGPVYVAVPHPACCPRS